VLTLSESSNDQSDAKVEATFAAPKWDEDLQLVEASFGSLPLVENIEFMEVNESGPVILRTLE